MRSFAVGVLALAAEVAALPAPQGVTENIPPSAPAPAGCQASYPGSFMITVQNVTSTPAKVKRQSQPLMITLADGVLKDAQQRTGYVASNYQFQFDGPPQAGAIYTSGFSVCSNGSLALGGSAIWWQCYSGGFYNLYDRWWAEQCSPIYINVLGGSAAAAPAPAAGAATQLPDGQPGVSTQVQQIGDGQVQATPVPVGQIADGQVQGPTGAPVGQIGDGQIQAPTGAPVGQIGDGQVQAPTGAPVGQIGDGQVQAPTGAPVGQIGDGQVQAPTGAPVGQIGDGQVQAPTGAPVGQIGDGQVQAPTAAPAPPATTAAPVGQIGDGQVQAPTGAPVGQIGDGQVQVSSQVVQAASPTSSYQPLQVTANAAPIMKHEGAAIVAGLAAAMALL